MSRITRSSSALVLTAALLASTSGTHAAIRYVKAGPVNGNGTSWASAYNNVQSAITASVPGDQIYIAAGTYIPTVRRESNDERSKTFAFKGGVQVLGGFPAAGGTLAERNSGVHLTILSGDLLGNDGATFTNINDNAYHVVYLTGSQSGTVLDGLVIQGGNANVSNSGFDYERGGGLYTANTTGTPQVRSCTLRNNSAAERGGGMDAGNLVVLNSLFHNNRAGQTGEGGGAMVASVQLIGCRFIGNTAMRGGGLKQGSGSLALTNCWFSGNRANAGSSADVGIGGGAMVIGDANTAITACTFVGNTATALSGVDEVDSMGGGLYMTFANPAATIYNTIFWDNTRYLIQPLRSTQDQSAQLQVASGVPNATGWNIIMNRTTATGTSNLSSNPLFVNAKGADNTYGTLDDSPAIQTGSPAVDSGNGTIMPADTFDIDGDGVTNEPIPLDVARAARYVDVPAAANTGQGGLWNDRGAFEVQAPQCYANCDNSTAAPVLNVNDFICFQVKFAAGDTYANCDNSTAAPVLNVNDFICFQSRFAAGCQ